MKTILIFLAQELILVRLAVAPDCTPLTGRFEKHDEVQRCTGQDWPNQWLTVCTVDWGILNPNNVCSRLTNSPSTVTKTAIVTKTFLRCTTNITQTILVSVTTTVTNIQPRRTTSTSLITATTRHGDTMAKTQANCPSFLLKTPSQTPVPSLKSTNIPNFSSKSGISANTVSIVTLGVVTGILLVSLVMVIAGWVWTCVRTRPLRLQQSPTTNRNHNMETDIIVEENEAYGGVIKHTAARNNDQELDIIVEENEAYGGVTQQTDYEYIM